MAEYNSSNVSSQISTKNNKSISSSSEKSLYNNTTDFDQQSETSDVLSDTRSIISEDEISNEDIYYNNQQYNTKDQDESSDVADDEYEEFMYYDDDDDLYDLPDIRRGIEFKEGDVKVVKRYKRQITDLDDYQEQEWDMEEYTEEIDEENFMYKLNEALIEDSPERIIHILKFVPMDIDVYEEVLESLLPVAIENNSIVSYREMLKKFKEIYETSSAVSINPYTLFLCKNRPDTIIQLYAMNMIPADMYKFLCDCFDIGVGALIEEIATLSDEPKSAQYAKRVLEAYGVSNLYYLRELYELVKEKDNIRVEEAIAAYIAKVSETVGEYSEKPKYIASVGNIIPSVPEIKFPILSADQLFEYYKKVHTKPEYVLPEDHDRMLKELVETENEQISKVLYLRDIISEDIEFHRLFGPSHNNIRRGAYSYDATHICERYGGCRMLLCNCVEGIDEELQGEELEDADWFKGRCEVCGIGIRSRRYAVRRARKSGGWSGCYCSYGCVRSMKNMDRMDKEIQDEVEYSLKSNLIYEKIDASEEIKKYSEATLLKCEK